MSHQYKLADGISSPEPQRGGTLTQATKPVIDRTDDRDWEIIDRDDYDDYEKKPQPTMPKCGMSATGSLQIGRGEKKKEVFAFNFSTGSKCGNCAGREQGRRRESQSKGSQSSNKEDDEETIIGEEEQFDRKTELLDEKGLSQKF